jgi:hypothetical protein
MTYRYIKCCFNRNKRFSSVRYLWKDENTDEYYLSLTGTTETRDDQQYMLIKQPSIYCETREELDFKEKISSEEMLLGVSKGWIL